SRRGRLRVVTDRQIGQADCDGVPYRDQIATRDAVVTALRMRPIGPSHCQVCTGPEVRRDSR
ncbi:hypothetical protein Taro_052694, partial [Colocasia esculenta]|nr:hypothetical protein [Colocasia esculenta]